LHLLDDDVYASPAGAVLRFHLCLPLHLAGMLGKLRHGGAGTAGRGRAPLTLADGPRRRQLMKSPAPGRPFPAADRLRGRDSHRRPPAVTFPGRGGGEAGEGGAAALSSRPRVAPCLGGRMETHVHSTLLRQWASAPVTSSSPEPGLCR
jgi:hypothetical protein